MALKSLSTEQINTIQSVIYQWRSKPFKWELIVERIHAELEIETTRQTLAKYPRIEKAYKTKKKEFSNNQGVSAPLSDGENAEIKALREENDRLMAFIGVIKDKAQTNPLLLQVLNDVANDLRRRN